MRLSAILPLSVVSLFLGLCVLSNDVHAANRELENVVSKAAAAKSQWVSIDFERGNALKSAAFHSMENLRTHLDSLTDKRSANYFQQYCNELQASLEANDVCVDKINVHAKKLYGSNNYFNTKPFLDLRENLLAYVFWLRTTEETDAVAYQSLYESHLQNAMDELQRDAENPDLAEIASSVNWLVHSGHARDFVHEFQETFRYEAAYIDVNPEHEVFKVSEFQQQVDQTQFASNLILGTSVSGDYRMTGNLKVELLDRKDRATARLYLDNGKISSDNSVGVRAVPGLNGQVMLRGKARTTIEYAYVDLYFENNQIHFDKPIVKCRSQSDMSDVRFQRNYLLPNKRLRREGLGLGPDFLESILAIPVSLAVNRKKEEADQEASRVADQNLVDSLEQQISKELTKVSKELQKELEKVIEPNTVRQGIYFDHLLTASSPNRVRLSLDKRGVANIGAPMPRKTHDSEMDSVLELMIHESSFLNFFTEIGSGARWDDTTWAYMQKTFSGLNSYCFLIGTRERWSCKMDWDAPVSLRLDNGLMTFAFRIQQMTIQGKTYDCPFKVSAAYRPRIRHYGIDMIREGDMKIEWQSEDRDDKLEKFVKETFDDLLSAKQNWDSMIIPYGGTFGDMENFRIGKLTVEDGWFVAEVSPGQPQGGKESQPAKEVTLPRLDYSSIPR